MADRELDALIAQKLFGWMWWSFDGGHYSESMDGGKRGHYQHARVRDFFAPWQDSLHADRWRAVNIAECTEAEMSLPIRYQSGYQGGHAPPYSNSWEAMRQVIEAMQARGWWCDMQSPFSDEQTDDDETSHLWSAGFWPHKECKTGEGLAYADSLPEAVCRAALKALETMESEST